MNEYGMDEASIETFNEMVDNFYHNTRKRVLQEQQRIEYPFLCAVCGGRQKESFEICPSCGAKEIKV